MASLYIRNLSDNLVKAVRMKALTEDKRIDELVAPLLELLVSSIPTRMPEPLTEKPVRRRDIKPSPIGLETPAAPRRGRKKKERIQ